ncbi:hypothetical protein [Saccharomonospora xinjiangensis]|uniref:Uncharacterized protein n=1 Tax=Saccharomonospora xinjiangensis XJ-54 TaxID=882086 RepID=I0UXS9_9PSEU|nr:hypothetical protein [Saccharomonospora xinjiangensis]EID52682.1 hypothetical protein SacxiDRAFT_0405 [Saccharomonospora xinjiangensis XJ-54]
MTNTAPLPAVGNGPAQAIGPVPGPVAQEPQGGSFEPQGGRGGPSPFVLGAVLVGVAVVAGLFWGLIRSGDGGVVGTPQAGAPSSDPLKDGRFDYEVVTGPVEATDCSANAYGDMIQWFADHPCEKVLRGLYTVQEGEARALVSVVLVVMPENAQAQQLKAVTDTDGTGNVNDLVRDGTATLPKAPVVAQGEYHSEVNGREVTIVEANFFEGHSDAQLLAEIGEDAARLSEHLSEG